MVKNTLFVKNTFFVVLFAAMLFVLYPHVVETVNGSSTKTFDIVLEDSSEAVAIVISSEPYNESQWVFINGVISAESRYSSDVDHLNKRTTKLLKGLDYAIVAVNISKKVTKIIISDTKR